jgi:hypothetical protein
MLDLIISILIFTIIKVLQLRLLFDVGIMIIMGAILALAVDGLVLEEANSLLLYLLYGRHILRHFRAAYA